jgi:hypothetical protein
MQLFLKVISYLYLCLEILCLIICLSELNDLQDYRRFSSLGGALLTILCGGVAFFGLIISCLEAPPVKWYTAIASFLILGCVGGIYLTKSNNKERRRQEEIQKELELKNKTNTELSNERV